MTANAFTVALLYGIGIGIIVFLVGCAPRNSRLNAERNEWLFENMFEKLYDAFLGDKDPIQISKILGLEYDKYMIACSIVGKEPNFQKETMMRIVGMFSFFFCIPLSVILYSPIPFVVGIALYAIMCMYPVRSTYGAANRKKLLLQSEMPRFIDLLLSALEVNLPIDIAIQQTAESVPCVLSDELKTTFAETQLGAKNWQQALESIAAKYEIDQLSDFVLNIVTAFNKGVSVTDAVARESHAVRQAALLSAKERTTKMSSAILLPLMIFKIIPLMAIMLIPIIMQSMEFLG